MYASEPSDSDPPSSPLTLPLLPPPLAFDPDPVLPPPSDFRESTVSVGAFPSGNTSGCSKIHGGNFSVEDAKLEPLAAPPPPPPPLPRDAECLSCWPLILLNTSSRSLLISCFFPILGAESKVRSRTLVFGKPSSAGDKSTSPADRRSVGFLTSMDATSMRSCWLYFSGSCGSGPSRIAHMTTINVAPTKACFKVLISKMMQPRDHTSALSAYCVLPSASGDM